MKLSHTYVFINTQYMTNSTLVSPVNMEYVTKNNDDEKWSIKNYFEIPPCVKPFLENHFYFIERGIFASNFKFSNKNDLLCAWRDFNKTFCGISTYHHWMFKLQISSIFNFDWAHKSWISGVLGVNEITTPPEERVNIFVPVCFFLYVYLQWIKFGYTTTKYPGFGRAVNPKPGFGGRL